MTTPTLQMTADERKRSLANLKLERDAIYLYDRLGEIETDPKRGSIFKRIASNERRHADIWATRLTELGAKLPAASTPRLRVRFIVALARAFGTDRVADLVRSLEATRRRPTPASRRPRLSRSRPMSGSTPSIGTRSPLRTASAAVCGAG